MSTVENLDYAIRLERAVKAAQARQEVFVDGLLAGTVMTGAGHMAECAYCSWPIRWVAFRYSRHERDGWTRMTLTGYWRHGRMRVGALTAAKSDLRLEPHKAAPV